MQGTPRNGGHLNSILTGKPHGLHLFWSLPISVDGFSALSLFKFSKGISSLFSGGWHRHMVLQTYRTGPSGHSPGSPPPLTFSSGAAGTVQLITIGGHSLSAKQRELKTLSLPSAALFPWASPQALLPPSFGATLVDRCCAGLRLWRQRRGASQTTALRPPPLEQGSPAGRCRMNQAQAPLEGTGGNSARDIILP